MAATTPGLVCAHHHLYSALARGMPPPPAVATDFQGILEQIWWRLDAALDLEMIRWSAMLGALEALESGTTAIVDHHESPNAIEGSLSVIAEACAEVGVRVLPAYGITDRHGADGARRGLEENRRFIEAGNPGLVGIHAAFTCSDESLRAVILTGGEAKRPAFVAGADIAELAQQGPLEAKDRSELGQALCDLIEGLGCPVIAAVNGFAFGGGLELALACHIRLASEDARMGLPEVSLGIIPGFGGTQRLPRVIGLGPALEMLTTGRHVLADEALSLGLVNHVYPADQLMDEARSLAQKIGSNGPIAVRYVLEAALIGRSMPLSEAQAYETNLFGLISATEDMREGMKAFLEKRSAEFRNE